FPGCSWPPREPRESLAGDERELAQELEALLVSAFRYRTVADVPVGVFLSGGLDSSLVAARLPRHCGQPLHASTGVSTETGFDDSPPARAVAEHLGTRHTERML